MRRIIGAAAAAVLLVLACASPAQAARGQGTMLVFDNTTCAGTGNAPSVTLPFSLLFTGFEPGATGTVSAYTQPGGELVGTATLTLDDTGRRCAFVDGDVESGMYKIVYDFGSGTGKQKVIRVRDPDQPTGTPEPPEPSESTITATSTVTTTSTATETVTATSTTTDEVTSPPATITETSTATVTSTSTATATVTETSVVTTTPSPTSTDDEGGLVIRPVDPLAPSGATSSGLLPLALTLIALGLGAMLLAWSNGAPYRRRH